MASQLTPTRYPISLSDALLESCLAIPSCTLQHLLAVDWIDIIVLFEGGQKCFFQNLNYTHHTFTKGDVHIRNIQYHLFMIKYQEY